MAEHSLTITYFLFFHSSLIYHHVIMPFFIINPKPHTRMIQRSCCIKLKIREFNWKGLHFIEVVRSTCSQKVLTCLDTKQNHDEIMVDHIKVLSEISQVLDLTNTSRMLQHIIGANLELDLNFHESLPNLFCKPTYKQQISF